MAGRNGPSLHAHDIMFTMFPSFAEPSAQPQPLFLFPPRTFSSPPLPQHCATPAPPLLSSPIVLPAVDWRFQLSTRHEECGTLFGHFRHGPLRSHLQLLHLTPTPEALKSSSRLSYGIVYVVDRSFSTRRSRTTRYLVSDSPYRKLASLSLPCLFVYPSVGSSSLHRRWDRMRVQRWWVAGSSSDATTTADRES